MYLITQSYVSNYIKLTQAFQNNLAEYAFHFNRRKFPNVGMIFSRLMLMTVKSAPITWDKIPWDIDPLSEYFAGT